ncbi:MAG: Gfo/Idh/MocA family oxidoreductase [Oscillospiraceae bacterium]|nr:Gfo/Idh/MocA family oxidoreductase [Oscillospiraceae bacterium]
MAKKGKLKVGIIGTSGIAGAHFDCYKRLEDTVEIVGGSDIIPGKARAFFDRKGMPEAKAFEKNADLLSLGLDAVSVCTYNSTHAECSIESLKANANVLCEKPMCVTLTDAIAMYETAKKKRKILMVGFQPRFDPNMNLIREVVGSGVLGDIYYVQTGGGRRRGMPGGNFILKDKAGAGALADIGCYSLDMVMSALGYPKPLTVSACTANKFGTNPLYSKEHDKFEVDDFSVALIRLEGGIALDFRMSWIMHMDTTGDTMFFGSKGGLKIRPAGLGSGWGGAWDGTIGPIYLYSDVAGQMCETPIPMREESHDRFFLKVKSFIEAVRDGAPSPIPTIESVYNQAIVDGIIRSSAAGKEVAVELDIKP